MGVAWVFSEVSGIIQYDLGEIAKAGTGQGAVLENPAGRLPQIDPDNIVLKIGDTEKTLIPLGMQGKRPQARTEMMRMKNNSFLLEFFWKEWRKKRTNPPPSPTRLPGTGWSPSPAG